jgi:hypothetical protein
MAATIQTNRLQKGLIKHVITLGANNDAQAFQLPRVYSAGLDIRSSDFGGGTVAIQAAPNGTDYLALPTAVSTTSTAIKSIAVADLGFVNYRAIITGATAPATVTITIHATELPV